MAELLPNWETHDVEALRRFSKIKLIVADLDGTLLPSELSQTIQDLTNSLSHYRYQVHFTIATGRTLAGVKPLLEKLPLNLNLPLILYNGSLIIKNGSFSILNQKTISLENLENIIKIASNYCVRTFGYFYTDPFFSASTTEGHEFVLGWASNCEPGREFNNMPVRWLTEFNEYSLEPSAVLVETSNDTESAQVLEDRLSKLPNISITRSGFQYIEIRPKESNKGIAIKLLAKELNLNRDEILALGDNDNDSEMLSWVGIGVAIAKASTNAIQNSDYICRHGVFQGAVEILRLVKHAKHYYFHPHRKNPLEFEPL